MKIDFLQSNVINFEILGLTELKGALKIDASFEVISDKRVQVTLSNAVLVCSKTLLNCCNVMVF